jgi:hypothetical protein
LEKEEEESYTEEGEDDDETMSEITTKVKQKIDDLDLPKKLFNSPSQFLANKLSQIQKKNTKIEF